MRRLLQRWPLWIQIWLVFVCFVLVCLLFAIVLTPRVLNDYFEQEIHQLIHHGQEEFVASFGDAPVEPPIFPSRRGGGVSPPPPYRDRNDPDESNSRTIRHVVVPLDRLEQFEEPLGRGPGMRGLPREQAKALLEQAINQKVNRQAYTRSWGKETLFYSIYRPPQASNNVVVISYMWSAYLDALVQTLYGRLMLLFSTILLLSAIPAVLLARYVSKPLRQLAQSVMRIADRQWDDPIGVSRNDEIGKLAGSIERMRQRLKTQDEAQQQMLQHVSHELKTPVMVIQSYAQSIRDGIYPHGTVSGSVDVIVQEANRLQKRIHDLLYMTRLQYLANQPMRSVPFDLGEEIQQIVARFQVRRIDLQWQIDLQAPTVIVGDVDQWVIAIENVLDNALRYAKSRVGIRWYGDVGVWRTLEVMNDGPQLSPSIQEKVFHTFAHGPDGQFGLGLAIAQRIAERHGVVLQCKNVDAGVAFVYVWMQEPEPSPATSV